MKNRTKDASQLIVLTHNYSFFKEIKNWFMRLDQYKKREEEKTCFFYMLQNSCIGGNRVPRLECLDKLLRDYDSEYHYLFSLVYKNSTSDVESLEMNYLFPNISRRLLESFLAFRVPSKKDLPTRLKEIKFDNVRKDRIYRFVNDNSHSGHITGDPDRDLSFLAETRQVSIDLMDLFKEIDAPHFNEMKKIITP
jgi:wobble nucleotide-excising tRNase